MYAMAVVMKVVLGWNINFSIWVASVTVALYVMLGGLLSAIFNEVLQFVLIWVGAALIPILGLIEAGGWTKLQGPDRASTSATPTTPTCGAPSATSSRQPHGHPLDRHRLRPRLRHQLRLLDHRLPRRAARAHRQEPARRQDGSHHRRGLQDGGAVHRHPARPARPRRAAEPRRQRHHLVAEQRRQASPASTATTKCCR